MGILGGLCETFSLGVRSLVVHLSTRACSVVINSRLGKEAVVERIVKRCYLNSSQLSGRRVEVKIVTGYARLEKRTGVGTRLI